MAILPHDFHVNHAPVPLLKVEILEDIDSTKADSDKKSYRLIRLPNGLRALLVHDPSTARR